MTCADLISVLDNTTLADYFFSQLNEKKVDYELIVKWLNKITDDISSDSEIQKNISRNILDMINDPKFAYECESFILTQYTSSVVHKEEMTSRVFDLPSNYNNVLHVFITSCKRNISSSKVIGTGLLKNCELFLKHNNVSGGSYDTGSLELCIRLCNNKPTNSVCVIL
jgi:hypothetical protein